jgi:DNA topoisomerase-1
VGRYGPYIEREGQRATVSDDIAPDQLTVEKAEELLSQGQQQRELGTDPDTGLSVVVKTGRYGPYVTEVLENGEKPRTASLFKTMSPETLTLEDALLLLSLPRTLGVDPADDQEILAMNGRYGPYIKKGSETRSLGTEEQLLTVTLDEALALLAQPKQQGRRAAAAPPLRELGNDPVSGKPMVVKNGRFGPYVTDGELNASLRSADTVETLTPQRGAELLAARREAGPPKKRRKQG